MSPSGGGGSSPSSSESSRSQSQEFVTVGGVEDNTYWDPLSIPPSTPPFLISASFPGVTSKQVFTGWGFSCSNATTALDEKDAGIDFDLFSCDTLSFEALFNYDPNS